MKPTRLLIFHISGYWVILLLFNACTSLSLHEINSLDKNSFDALQLDPGVEANDLRVDVIRNTTLVYIDEYQYMEQPVPYHPLGFDLGNGLFYDLNGNLSFRIDYLLDFNPEDSFSIEENIKPETNKMRTLYQYSGDSLVFEKLQTGKQKLIYRKESYADSNLYYLKNKLKYKIIKLDSSMVYQWKNRKPQEIIRAGEGKFVINPKKGRWPNELKENEIQLGKVYIVRSVADGEAVTINTYNRKNKSKVLLTIQQSDRALYIFNKRDRGVKIELYDDHLIVFGPNSKMVKAYFLSQQYL